MLRRWLRSGRRTWDADPPLQQSTGSAEPASPTVQSVVTGAEEAFPDHGGDRTDGPVHSASPRFAAGAEERVRALLASDAVSPVTRGVLTARLDALNVPPIAAGERLSDDEVKTLRAVTDRLIPQDHRERRVDIVGAIDARLAAGRTDGWRYDALPPDADALRRGLSGLDEAARERHAVPFAGLSTARRDDILRQIQAGTPPGETWRTLSPERWFEEVLAESCEVYYADPIAQDEIGYVGYADLPAWQAIGLDQRDAREIVAGDDEPRSPGGSADV